MIADGHHLDLATLRVLARAKGPAQTILISDASPLAGLPPGVYGEWAVDPSGKIVVAGTPYLAGSNQGLEVGLQNLLAASGWTLAEVHRRLSRPIPLGCSGGRCLSLAPASPPTWSSFGAQRPDIFVLERVCVRRPLGYRADGSASMRRKGRAAPRRPAPLVFMHFFATRPSLKPIAAGSLPSTQSPSSF